MIAKVKIGKNTKNIELSPTESVYRALVKNGLVYFAPCGGRGKCGKCKARLLSSDFWVDTDENNDFLTCKCYPKGNMSIEISDNFHDDIDLQILSSFSEEKCEIALDLGTTTLCFLVLNEKKEIFAKTSVLNPQRVLGADVLSRITYCEENGVEFAHNLVVEIIAKVINRIKEKTGVKEIDLLTVCGNTVMTHILMNVNPKSLGTFPFNVVFKDRIICKGEELGLNVKNVTVFPSFNAFIGGDIVSGIGCLKLGKRNKNELFVDVGTNGEMVLSSNGKYFATSTSAGPAFEGGRIECGTGGVLGAVCKVFKKTPFWDYETIEKYEPKGICGAGILDFISCALNVGAIDETGKIVSGKTGVKGDKIYLTRDIYLSQSDIREIQLAKSAIRCGMDALISSAMLKYSDVDAVYISGGMGCKLDVSNACKIGLIPIELFEKCKQIENTAVTGLLNGDDLEFVSCCENFLSRTEYVELSLCDGFNEEFIKNLNF